MKIGIITQPLQNNYGGILQNYALQDVLKKMGHEVITIDQKYPKIPLWRMFASTLKTVLSLIPQHYSLTLFISA